VITLTLTQALGLYAIVVGIIAAAIWVYTEAGTQRMYQTLKEQHLWRCAFCAFTYLDESSSAVSECPRCGSFNTLDDNQARTITATGAIERRTEPMAEPASEPRRNPSRRSSPSKTRRGPRRRGGRR
jgi:hypothetical protein